MGYIEMHKISDDFFLHVERGKEGNNQGFPFTIAPINELVEGILASTYYLILGPSGSGKSSLLYEQFILNFVDKVYAGKLKAEDIVILLFSLEISPVKFYSKAIARFIYKKYKLLISTRDIANSKGNASNKMYEYIYSKETKRYLDVLDTIVKVYTKATPVSAYKALQVTLAPLSEKVGTDSEGNTIYALKNPKLKVIAALDHIALPEGAPGDNLKMTIDTMSKKVFVKYRNSHGVIPVVLQQITPNEDNMKKVVYSHKDARDSKNTYHDCDVCLSIGSPMEAEKESIQFKGQMFHVIPSENNDYRGLENRIRVIAKEKDRDGESFLRVVVGFVGECGMFTDLGPAESVNYEFYNNLGK
jgi:hypothetical protein